MAEIGKTNLGPNFYQKLVNVTNSVGMHPEDVLAIMVSESGIKNNSFEPHAKGGGIFAAMPDTQKRLGFKGTPEEFTQLSGEQQLDYFQKFLQGAVQNAGGPIKSAEQYYVANFIPAAMRLPGIKRNDMNTVFLEKNPETVQGKDGVKYSKKYWDIGVHLPASQETLFYNTNTLFHGHVKDAISLGSMKAQVDKNKQAASYKQALKALSQVANYVPKSNSESQIAGDTGTPAQTPSSQVAQNTPSTIKNLWDKFTGMLKSLDISGGAMPALASKDDMFLISIGASQKEVAIKYANVLSVALKEYLGANSEIHLDEYEIEVQATIGGDHSAIAPAIKEFSKNLADEFDEDIEIAVFDRTPSNLPVISFEANEILLRKFAMKRGF